MAVLLGLPRLLSDHGLDPDAVIRGMGCDPALFQDPDNIIAFSAVGRLLAHTSTVSSCRYPGIEIGRHLGLDVIGPVGRAARLAPNVGTALNADADRYAEALRDLESLDATFGGGLADKVRRVLMRLMVTGVCLTEPALDRAAVAELLGVGPPPCSSTSSGDPSRLSPLPARTAGCGVGG